MCVCVSQKKCTEFEMEEVTEIRRRMKGGQKVEELT